MHPQESPFTGLVDQLGRWQQSLEELRLTVTEDRPATNDVALADQLEDAVTDALAACRMARDCALQAGEAEVRSDRPTAKLRLSQVHEVSNRLGHLHATSLAGWERMRDLNELGRRRGRRWGQWSTACVATLQDWPVQMVATLAQLLRCWQHLVDNAPAGTRPHSVPRQPDATIFRN